MLVRARAGVVMSREWECSLLAQGVALMRFVLRNWFMVVMLFLMAVSFGLLNL